MVVSQDGRMVRSFVCLCWLVNLLRQRGYDEFFNRVVSPAHGIRLDLRGHRHSFAVCCLETQPLFLCKKIRRVELLLHMFTLWDSQLSTLTLFSCNHFP